MLCVLEKRTDYTVVDMIRREPDNRHGPEYDASAEPKHLARHISLSLVSGFLRFVEELKESARIPKEVGWRRGAWIGWGRKDGEEDFELFAMGTIRERRGGF
jgi:hypothetical protein